MLICTEEPERNRRTSKRSNPFICAQVYVDIQLPSRNSSCNEKEKLIRPTSCPVLIIRYIVPAAHTAIFLRGLLSSLEVAFLKRRSILLFFRIYVERLVTSLNKPLTK